jgi:hypothetical protein
MRGRQSPGPLHEPTIFTRHATRERRAENPRVPLAAGIAA